MRKRPLGRSGLEVSEIGLGAWALGGTVYGDVSEEDAHRCLGAYLERGGNLIDTAHAYGESERIVGEFLHGSAAARGVIISSKSGAPDPGKVREQLETSLKALRRDCIDVYYLHSPPEDAGAMERLLDAYERFKEEGKIRIIGASIKGPSVGEDTAQLCRQYIATGRVGVLMVIYSIFRQGNRAVLREAEEAGVGVMARTILENGFLGGRHAPGETFSGGDHRTRWGSARLGRILGETRELSGWAVEPPYGSIAQVAIRFALDESGVSSAVLGARNAEHVIENINAAGNPPLPDALRERLVSTYADRGAEFNPGD